MARRHVAERIRDWWCTPRISRPPSERLLTSRLLVALAIVGVFAAAGAADASAMRVTPVVTHVSPSRGPLAGGTTVTISGENFIDVSAVKFGSSEAKSFTVNSETSVTAVSPPEPAGTVDVTVSKPHATSATSPADQFTYQLPPSNISPPAMSGTAQQGQTLTDVHGSWTNEPTSFAYQWLQCNASGEACVPIPGTGQTWSLYPGDVGHTLRAEETAVNAGGSSEPAISAATAVVTPEPQQTGNVAAWGAGDQYELGALWASSPSSSVLWPVGSVVAGALEVAAGYHGSYALMPNGTVLSWGGDGEYQLGHGWRISEKPPPSESEGRLEARSPKARPVVGTNWTSTNPTVLEEVSAIAASGPNAIALLKDGEVRDWGPYYGGALGNGTDAERREHAEVGSPKPVSPLLGPGGPNLSGIKAIAAGGGAHLAITQEGRVFGWGINYSGNLGPRVGGSAHTAYPVEIPGLSDVVEAANGSNDNNQAHSLFLVRKPNGETEILALGSNKEGELGHPGVAETNAPVQVLTASGEVLRHVISVGASEEGSFALVEPKPDEREVLAWGRNNGGELGNGSITSSGVPVKVLGPGGEANFPQPITYLHAGKYYGQVLAAGKLFAWGGNLQGQIGDGTEANKLVPLEVKTWNGTPLPSRVLSVSGYEHAIALLQGAVAPRMMTATLENPRSPSQQITLTWETPGNVNMQMRIEAKEQIEPWEATISYNAGEKVEYGGVYYVARVGNSGVVPGTNASIWESGATARKIVVSERKLPETARSYTLALPDIINNPYWEVVVKELRGPGTWKPDKRVNTQWMP